MLRKFVEDWYVSGTEASKTVIRVLKTSEKITKCCKMKNKKNRKRFIQKQGLKSKSSVGLNWHSHVTCLKISTQTL